METQNLLSGNTSLLKQFAVKSDREQIVYGDRAITYNRCSTKKQDSIGWQSKITYGFVKTKNWAFVKSFGAKESAKTNDRVVFNEMREFCKRENISHIVFYSYDRFSRAGNLNLIDDLRAEGIKVHSATQDLDDDTPSGRLMQKIFLILAEAENQLRREKIIEGQRNKLRKGEWIGRPTIGYEKEKLLERLNNPLIKPQCILNEKAELIRQAFQWRDEENLSYNKIIERLKNMGLCLKKQQLSAIFRNIFYCGFITHKLLDKGEIIQGKHTPIIDVETFLRVNGLLSLNPQGWTVGKDNEEMPLKPSVCCGKCFKPLTAYRAKEKYIYYKCFNTGCCINIRNEKLHKLFECELSKLIVLPPLVPYLKTQLASTFEMLHSNEVARTKPMKDELARLKNDLEAMEFTVSTGKIPLDLYQKHSSEQLQKIHAIEAELRILVRDTSNLSLYIDKVLQIGQNLPKMWHLLDFDGKVRLQKLVYPQGLVYIPENKSLRTITVNPIFSAFSSISQISSSESSKDEKEKIEMSAQLYSSFTSSNFFWENLEKVAIEVDELKYQLRSTTPVISITGNTPAFLSFNSTENQNKSLWLSNVFRGTHGAQDFTGATDQWIYK